MSEEDSASDDEIEFRYAYSEDYKLHPATGVRGGIQPNGNFRLDFVNDDFEIPDADIYEVTDDGLGELVRQEGGNRVIRQLQTGVSLSQIDAYQTATWILSSLLGDSVSSEQIEEVIETEFEERFE